MTNTGMAHEEARDALAALALDALSASERDAVLAHLAGCAECWDELAALKENAAELSYIVHPIPMPDDQRERVRARLMARAAAGHRSTPSSVPAISPAPQHHVLMPSSTPTPVVHLRVPAWERGLPWFAAAASLVAVVTSAGMYQVARDRDEARAILQVVSGQGSASMNAVDSLRSALDDRDRLIANLTGPRVQVMTLAANGTLAPSARMFWDQSVDAWTFVAHNLPRPKAGRTYQLWLVTASSEKVSAGTFAPTANGDAVVRATYALGNMRLAAVAVTDEPTGGSPQPTTVPFIVGANSTK